jgi:signal transduction histidine kinase
MRLSILKKITILILMLLIILSLAVYTMYYGIQSLGKQMVEQSSLLIVKSIEEAVRQVGGEHIFDLVPEKKQRLRRLISGLTTRRGSILSIILIDSTHQIILSSTKEVEGNTYLNADELQLLATTETKIHRRIWDDMTPVLDIIVPIEKAGLLRVVLARDEIESYLKDLPILLLASFAFITSLFLIGIALIVRIYRKPLQSLNQAVEKFSQGDYQFRVNYTHQDEFTDTFTALNRSMDQMVFLKEGYKTTEKKIHALLQAVQDGILVLDNEHKPTSFNKATLKLLNTTDQKFPSRFLEILENNPLLTDLIHSAAKQGKTVHEKNIALFLTEDVHLSLSVTLIPLWEENKFVGTIITLKDVRSIKEIENNLLRAMKYGIITNLTSSISHELKNPLSALAMHGEIVENRIQKTEFNGKDQSLKSLHTIQNEVKRLNRIIQQFLSLTRKSKEQLDYYDCNKIIDEVLLLVQQQAQENNISLELDLKNNLPLLYGDADQIKQVIINIVINAFAAMENGGILKVATKRDNGRIKLHIDDNGKGIPVNIQKHIFDLYFSTKEEGGGIGLALCKNIVEAHEGKITFRSTEGKGTHFCIILPIREPTITDTKILADK